MSFVDCVVVFDFDFVVVVEFVVKEKMKRLWMAPSSCLTMECQRSLSEEQCQIEMRNALIRFEFEFVVVVVVNGGVFCFPNLQLWTRMGRCCAVTQQQRPNLDV